MGRFERKLERKKGIVREKARVIESLRIQQRRDIVVWHRGCYACVDLRYRVVARRLLM